MKGAEGKLAVIIFLFSALIIPSEGLERVRVTIGNHLGGGRALGIDCGSRDDDLGFQTLVDRDTVSWDFRMNLSGTTSYYCDVNLPGNSEPKHFYAFSYQRDSDRCRECDWLIQEDERLYGRNPFSGSWDYMPYEE